MKALGYFETLGITYPTTQGNVSEDVSHLWKGKLIHIPKIVFPYRCMVDRRLGYTRIANRGTCLGCEIIFLLIPLYPWKSPPHWLGQEWTYPWRQVAGVTKFFRVAPNTCVPSVRNLFRVIIPAPRMLRCLLEFWKICAPPPPPSPLPGWEARQLRSRSGGGVKISLLHYGCRAAVIKPVARRVVTDSPNELQLTL